MHALDIDLTSFIDFSADFFRVHFSYHVLAGWLAILHLPKMSPIFLGTMLFTAVHEIREKIFNRILNIIRYISVSRQVNELSNALPSFGPRGQVFSSRSNFNGSFEHIISFSVDIHTSQNIL